MDFAVLPAAFASTEEALNDCDAMYGEPEGPTPAEVIDLVSELDRIDAMAEVGGFLSTSPDLNAFGAILCTRWPQRVQAIYTLLQMTSRRSLALVDVQRHQVFDPRGRTDVEVVLADGTRLPYLTDQIVTDVMSAQDHYGDYFVAKRADQDYVQALYARGQPCELEYRAGGPDRHFRTRTDDRSLVARLISVWLLGGPHGPLFETQRWERLQF